MLGNSIDHEKMALLISTNNHWPQNHHHIDEQKAFMDSTSGIRTIEKPNPDIVQQQQQLKCPRCDSSNTKFCYYNNYSLSQPRHFCKACKRYWTKGGTLRNVPVGGGCRKNKRVKRPVSAIDGVSSNNNNNNTTTTTTTSTSSAPPSNSNPPSQVSPLFYGFHTNPSDLNIPFSRFSASGVSNNVENISGFDHLQPQLNSLGLGFSSGDYRNGFDNPNKQIQDIVGSNSLFSSYNSIFTSPSSNITSATMASVLASKFSSGSGLKDGREPNSNFQTLTSFEGLQMGNTGGHDEVNMRMKYVKSEDAQNRLEWNSSAHHHQTEQINGLSDHSAIYWNGTSVSSNWHDPSNNNIGSSVPSLI